MDKSIQTPLADIHVHSDCSHSPSSIYQRAQEFKIPAFKDMSLAEVTSAIHPPQDADWATWYKHLKKVRTAYTSPQVIGALFEDLIRDADAHGVDLYELRISLISTTSDLLNNNGVTNPSMKMFWETAILVWNEILTAREKMDRALGMNTDLVVSITCQERYRSHVADLMKLCMDYADQIAGLDLTNEKDTPASLYRDQLEKARSKIKGLTVHCMEVTGPERGWDALEIEPDRIGHGINIVKDPALMEAIAEKRIPIEVLLKSNVVTGIIKKPEDHPFRKMQEAGLILTIGSDGANDGSTLKDNYDLLQKTFNLSDEEMATLRRQSFETAFRNLHP
jgi:adenosine deaminase